MKKFLLLGLCLVSFSAHATSVLWELSGVTFFEDGGTATGSFIWDSDTFATSSVAIETSVDGIFGGTYDFAEYGAPDPIAAAAIVFGVDDGSLFLPGSPAFGIRVTAPLTDAGGVVPIFIAPGDPLFTIEGSCGFVGCPFSWDETPGAFRTVASGSLIGTPLAAVPVPAAAWLFGSALGLLGWVRRRKT